MAMSGDLTGLLTSNNPVFSAYAFYTALLVVKMIAVSFLTSNQRMKKKVFASPEDVRALSKKAKVAFDDPDVERVRRAHLNDLENIPIFMIISFLYMLTNPSPTLAVNLFRVFTAARFLHTFVYVIYIVPQPARGIAFGAGVFTTIFMAVQVLRFFM